MNNVIIQKNSVLGILNTKYKTSIIAVLGYGLLVIIMLWLGLLQEQGKVIFGITVALPFFILFIRYPRIWIYFIVLSTIYFFRDSSDDISIIDVITGLLYYGTLFTWFFWMIFVKREKIIENIGDWFLLASFIFILFNLVISLMNDTTLLGWLREYLLLSLVLFSIPIKKYFKEKKYLIRLLMVFCFSVFIVDILQINDYRHLAFTELVYAYQLGSSIRINQLLFTSASLVGIIFAINQKELYKQVILIAFSGLTISALIVSFSRTFWIIVLVEIIIIFFYMHRIQKIRLLYYTGILSVLIIFFVFFAFKRDSQIFMTIIEKRLSSSTQGTQDISVVERLYEYRAVWKKIKINPLGGNGLGSGFNFYEPANEYNISRIYTHNGFLCLVFKFGFPLAIIFIIPLIYYLYVSERMARKINDKFYKMIALSACMILLASIIANFPSTQFASRDGVFVFAFGYSLAGIASEHYLINYNKKIV